jgi:hypothetical protein
VQDHRIHRHQFFALEPIDDEALRLLEIEVRKLRGDGIEPPYGAGIIVVVMADENPFG